MDELRKLFNSHVPLKDQDGFMQVVQQTWDIQVEGGPMWRFHLKLKNTCKIFSYWSKHTIGNIFDKTKEL